MALDMLVVSTVKPAPAPLVHTTDAAADVASDVLVPPMSQVRSQEKVQGTVAHVLLALLANMVSPAVTLLVMLPEMCAWLYTGSICGGGGGAARDGIRMVVHVPGGCRQRARPGVPRARMHMCSAREEPTYVLQASAHREGRLGST